MSPHASTLAVVDQEMKQRFSSFLHLQYFYQEEKVHDLEELIRSARGKGLNSLKLTAKNEFSKIEEASKESSSAASNMAAANMEKLSLLSLSFASVSVS